MPAFAGTATQPEHLSRIGFKKILIATDYSPCSRKAMHYGLAVARSYHSAVNLVSVVSSLGFAMAGPQAISEAVHLGIEEAANLRKHLQAGGFLEGTNTQIQVEYGTDVAKQLLSISEKYKPDLIVLGTHGRTGLTKIWMGSVAEQVFRSSTCPVLTVGPGVPWPKVNHQPPRILFPTDFSPESVAALGGCIALAEARGYALTLLHVAPLPRGEAAADRERIISGLETRLIGLLPPPIAHCTQARVVFGDVESNICSTAELEQCSLIVMGLHHDKSLLEGRWKHAYDVVINATCPVVTVRSVPKF